MTLRQASPGASSLSARRAARPSAALRTAIAATLVAAAVGLAGCTPGPAPKPTPTPLFTSEADAFKAAEQVFREFVDAKNAAQAGDESTDPQQFLAGPALEDDIQSVRDQQSDGTHIKGSTTVLSFSAKEFDPKSHSVKSAACVDVSKSRVINAEGQDVTPTDRSSNVALNIETLPVKAAMKIVRISGSAASCE
ncbi:hypothetical protein [Microbacterium sp. 22242]|uniref:hypothetical protein n=1 Tax=Microbacterium sp. 22242 TaxID=3453896 RepID=UPI003F83E58C